MTTSSKSLPYRKFKLTFTATQETVLTRYSGSTIRDMFRTALRQTCCSRRICNYSSCGQASLCSFAALCHPVPNAGQAAVNPYVLADPARNNNILHPVKTFAVYLSLFGNAIEYGQQIFAALEQMKNLDIEKFRCLITLDEVRKHGPPASWPKTYRPHGRLKITNIERISEGTLSLNSSLSENHFPGFSRGKINMLSPCRIIQTVIPVKGKRQRLPVLSEQITPGHLLTAIVNRFSNMTSDNLKKSAELANHFIQLANPIFKLAVKDEKSRRYSANFKKSQPNDGIVGTLSWDNLPRGTFNLFKIGEIISVGSGTTMGFGNLKVDFPQTGADNIQKKQDTAGT